MSAHCYHHPSASSLFLTSAPITATPAICPVTNPSDSFGFFSLPHISAHHWHSLAHHPALPCFLRISAHHCQSYHMSAHYLDCYLLLLTLPLSGISFIFPTVTAQRLAPFPFTFTGISTLPRHHTYFSFNNYYPLFTINVHCSYI